MIHTMDKRLPITEKENQSYFDAILTNDAAKVKQIFADATTEKKTNLLTSFFDYSSNRGFVPMNYTQRSFYRPTHPFHVAIGFSSIAVAEVMLQEDVNIFQTDAKGHNILHALVTVSHYYSRDEDKSCNTYAWLLQRLGAATCVKLLRHENAYGYRPLEYAVQQDCLKLFNVFMLTPECYVVKQEHHGLAEHKWIDISEYEHGERIYTNPLYLLSCLDKRKLQDPSYSDILHNPLLSSWINAKIKCSAPLVFAWFLLRCIALAAYLIFDRDFSNTFNDDQNSNSTFCEPKNGVFITKNEKTALGIMLYIFAGIGFIIDITETIMYFIPRFKFRGMFYSLLGRKQQAINMHFYRITHLVMNITLLTCIPVTFVINRSKMDSTGAHKYAILFVDIARVSLPLTMTWSLLFFIQFLPSIGKAVISIQSMIVDFGHFVILYAIFIFPFNHIFAVFLAVNSKEDECIEEFDNVYITTYSMFRMMLNMLDITQFDVKNIGILYGMHMLYVFMVAVVLVNFLIAVMATSAAEIEHQRTTLRMLNRLATAVLLERRLHWVLKRYYTFMRKRYFLVEDDKTYLFIASNRERTLRGGKQENQNIVGTNVIATEQDRNGHRATQNNLQAFPFKG